MQIQILRSKVHGLTLTDANLAYRGSLTLDEAIMERAGLLEFEKVLVVNNNNGERLETYLIKGEKGSGICCLNGSAARKGVKGDILIVMSFALVTLSEASGWMPVTLFPGPDNKLNP